MNKNNTIARFHKFISSDSVTIDPILDMVLDRIDVDALEDNYSDDPRPSGPAQMGLLCHDLSRHEFCTSLLLSMAAQLARGHLLSAFLIEDERNFTLNKGGALSLSTIADRAKARLDDRGFEGIGLIHLAIDPFASVRTETLQLYPRIVAIGTVSKAAQLERPISERFVHVEGEQMFEERVETLAGLSMEQVEYVVRKTLEFPNFVSRGVAEPSHLAREDLVSVCSSMMVASSQIAINEICFRKSDRRCWMSHALGRMERRAGGGASFEEITVTEAFWSDVCDELEAKSLPAHLVP